MTPEQPTDPTPTNPAGQSPSQPQSEQTSSGPPAGPPGSSPVAPGDQSGGEPDYRFTLANERTFLAYLRTALAIAAGGVALVEFVTTLGVEPLRRLLGVVLAATGVALTVGGFLRWRANLLAMRRHRPLPRTMMPLGLALGVLVMSLIALYLVAFG